MNTFKLKSSSELMDDYKRISVANGAEKMRAQIMNERILLFSTGHDRKFYLCVQGNNEDTEWDKICLTDSLSELAGTNCTVKLFDTLVVQNQLYLAVIVTVNKKEVLYLSISKDATKTAWKAIERPKENNRDIATLCLSSNGQEVFIITDTWTDIPGRTLRYRISATQQKWEKVPVALDISADTQLCKGRSLDEPIDGYYLLDRKKNFLLYTPLYNYYDSQVDPTTFTLSLPRDPRVIATHTFTDMEGINRTNLFLCGNRGLYLYAYADQKQDGRPYLLKMSEEFDTAIQLQVIVVKKEVIVWGLNKEGNLFILSCPEHSLEKDYMWSDVCVINSNVTYFLALEDPVNYINCYFAVTQDDKLLIGEQSSLNSLWTEYPMELPSANDKSFKTSVYRTRITVTDEEAPAAGCLVEITPLEDGMVYINGKSRKLKAYTRFMEPTDATGCIKIVQHLYNDIHSVNFELRIADSNHSISINPENASLDKLLELDSAQALKDARIPGSNERLVSIDNEAELNSIAQMITALKKQKTTLTSEAKGINDQFFGSSNEVVVLEISTEGIRHFEGEMALRQMPVLSDTDRSVVSNNVVTNIGNFFRHCYELIKKGLGYIKMAFTKLGEFIVEIAGKVYRFLIDCCRKIVEVLKMIFEAIKTVVRKMIEFLKYLFNWEDILKMKRALGNCMLLAKKELVAQTSGLQKKIDTCLQDFLKMANNVDPKEADALFASDTPSILSKNVNEINRQGEKPEVSVTDAFLLDHLTDNMGEGRLVSTPSVDANTNDTKIDDIVSRLQEALGTEIDIAGTMGQELLSLVSQIGTIPFSDLLKKLLNILQKAVLSTAANVSKIVIEVFGYLLDICFDLISKPIYIPLLSDILKGIGIPEFSFLDVVLLIGSMISTPILKLAMGKEKYAKIDFEKMEHARSLSELKESKSQEIADAGLDQWIFFNYENKTLSALFMGVEGTFSILGSILNYPTSKGKLLPGLQITAGITISISAFLSAGFYSSCSLGKGSSIALGIFGMLFTITGMGGIILQTLGKYKKNAKKKEFKRQHLGNALIVVGSTGTIICKIVEMVLVGIEKKFTAKEKTIYYIDASSCLIQNANGIVSVGGDYTEKCPKVGVILKITGSVLAVCITGLKIADAAIIS